VHVLFDTTATAYEFLSEIRRRSDSLLWDVRVRDSHQGTDVVIPRKAWDREPFMESVAATYGADVRDGSARTRDAPEGSVVASRSVTIPDADVLDG